MLLPPTTSLVRRLAALALVAAVECLAMLSPPSQAQGVSWSGVNEGSVIQLLSGRTSTNLAITASPTAPSSPTNLVLVLERQGNVVLSHTSAPPHGVTFTNLPPGKYFLTALLESPSRPVLGDLSFDISAASLRPANDAWNQAAILAVLDTPVTGSNVDATRQADEPALVGGSAGKSIWWTWTANTSGAVTATTAGSNFDTALGVYAGANLATLVTVAANDDIGPNLFSQVSFSATNGATYYFQVDGATGSAGGLTQLRLQPGLPPSLAITAPADGYLMLVASSAVATNVNIALTATDPAGIARVDYWFDGGTNVSRSGPLASPYQLSFTDLSVGHYLLMVAAANNAGLVSVADLGLSVISLEPVLVMERLAAMPGKFQVGLTGFKGPKYSLLSSTNLDVWCSVSTFTNFSGAVKVADTNVAQIPQNYFRATSTP